MFWQNVAAMMGKMMPIFIPLKTWTSWTKNWSQISGSKSETRRRRLEVLDVFQLARVVEEILVTRSSARARPGWWGRSDPQFYLPHLCHVDSMYSETYPLVIFNIMERSTMLSSWVNYRYFYIWPFSMSQTFIVITRPGTYHIIHIALW